jgi:tripartite-type tricarboxylate transporter receptor subunit TctC
VPALGELGVSADDKALLGLYASGGAIGRAFILPPGTNPVAVKALQTGFMDMVKDPEFLSEMEKASIDVDPLGPDELAANIRKTLAASPDVIARAKALFGR